MLGELSGEEKSDGSLDLSGGKGVLLVVADELGGLESDLFEDVTDEGVHDVHGSLGDAGLGVDLLEHSVDVDGEGLASSLVAFALLFLAGVLLGGLGGGGVSA